MTPASRQGGRYMDILEFNAGILCSSAYHRYRFVFCDKAGSNLHVRRPLCRFTDRSSRNPLGHALCIICHFQHGNMADNVILMHLYPLYGCRISFIWKLGQLCTGGSRERRFKRTFCLSGLYGDLEWPCSIQRLSGCRR